MKRSIKTDKRKWVKNIASEAEEAARSQHRKTLYRLTKMLCHERELQSTAILDKNGNFINGKDVIQSRWTENFKEVVKEGSKPNN